MKNELYMVVRLCRFDTHIEVGSAVKLDWPTGGDNPELFMPVFFDRKAAEEWAENGKYQIVLVGTEA